MNLRIRHPLYISFKILIMLLLAPYGRFAAITCFVYLATLWHFSVQ